MTTRHYIRRFGDKVVEYRVEEEVDSYREFVRRDGEWHLTGRVTVLGMLLSADPSLEAVPDSPAD